MFSTINGFKDLTKERTPLEVKKIGTFPVFQVRKIEYYPRYFYPIFIGDHHPQHILQQL